MQRISAIIAESGGHRIVLLTKIQKHGKICKKGRSAKTEQFVSIEYA